MIPPETFFSKLAELEPELARLLEAAKRADTGGPRFCANGVFFRDFRPRLSKFVGHERFEGPAVLQTRAAYDVACRMIRNALSDCRGCECLDLKTE